MRKLLRALSGGRVNKNEESPGRGNTAAHAEDGASPCVSTTLQSKAEVETAVDVSDAAPPATPASAPSPSVVDSLVSAAGRSGAAHKMRSMRLQA